MTTSHNHPPRCCCIPGSTATTISDSADPCPLCPEHGELATLDSQCDHRYGFDGDSDVYRCTKCHQLAPSECPSCHQLAGRPPTEYCQNPRAHIRSGDGYRTPGYDGPEGTEWPRHTPSSEHDTHYPPAGGHPPHHISHCPDLDCPPVPCGYRGCTHPPHPVGTVHSWQKPTITIDTGTIFAELPAASEIAWVDDGCRCPTAVHLAGCPTLPHNFRDATDDDGHPMPDTCAHCGKPELSPVHRGQGPIGGPS